MRSGSTTIHFGPGLHQPKPNCTYPFFKQWRELYLSIKTNEVYVQESVAKRGAYHHERLTHHVTRQSTTQTTHPTMPDRRAGLQWCLPGYHHHGGAVWCCFSASSCPAWKQDYGGEWRHGLWKEGTGVLLAVSQLGLLPDPVIGAPPLLDSNT